MGMKNREGKKSDSKRSTETEKIDSKAKVFLLHKKIRKEREKKIA